MRMTLTGLSGKATFPAIHSLRQSVVRLALLLLRPCPEASVLTLGIQPLVPAVRRTLAEYQPDGRSGYSAACRCDGILDRAWLLLRLLPALGYGFAPRPRRFVAGLLFVAFAGCIEWMVGLGGLRRRRCLLS